MSDSMEDPVSNVPLYEAKAELFRTLGHPVRIRVLELLQDGARPVHELLAEIEVEASNLSQQLAVLRRAGLVRSSRDGAAVLYAGVRDILVDKDAALTDSLDAEFAKLQALPDAQRVGNGFTLYTELSTEEIKAFADQVNALGEPLNQLTATLVL